MLKPKWHENGVSICLSVRPPGVKDFVDITVAENVIKNVNGQSGNTFESATNQFFTY